MFRKATRGREPDPIADPPVELVDRLDRFGTFVLDEEVYRFEVVDLRDLPISFDATLLDDAIEPDDRARVRFSVTNEGREPILLSSVAPAPFGVVEAEQPGGSAWTLWSDAYAEAPNVFTPNGLVWGSNTTGEEVLLQRHETIERTYELPLVSFAPGSYELDLFVDARYPSEEANEFERPLHYEFRFDVLEDGA